VRFSRSADPSYGGWAPYLIHYEGYPHLPSTVLRTCFPPPHGRGRRKEEDYANFAVAVMVTLPLESSDHSVASRPSALGVPAIVKLPVS
jgi:hypothetical protein